MLQAPQTLTADNLESHPEWFHPYQVEAWNSTAPITAICAGWQSGKTVSLPPWLLREIQRRGPGDYGAFSSTFALLKKKLLPELRKTFIQYCDYRAGDMQFVFTPDGSRRLWGSGWNGQPTVVQLGYSENPDSLESATLKAVVWDECGQRLVPEQSYRTVQSRLMVNRGRMLLASRPYESGWYERLVQDGESGTNRNVKVVSFPSWANPENPEEDSEYFNDLRSKLPSWMFTILYEGRFTRPLGQIYDTFDYNRDTCEDFEIPSHWNIYPGADFGPVNTAGVLIAEDPHSKELYAVHEYHSTVRQPMKDHVVGIRGRHPISVGAGGAHSEDGWREAASAAGLHLDEPPENDVEVQIQCVYEQIATHKLKFFRRACERLISDIQMMSREVDDDGNITDKIAKKSSWHRPDALRYIITKLRPPQKQTDTIASVVAHNTLNHGQADGQRHRWDLSGRARR